MISTWLPEEWPEKANKAAQRFRQGHLLEWDSVAFGANFDHGIATVTRESGSSGLGYVRVDEALSHVMIASQTCDICEEGKKTLVMPWISVIPVYDILPLLPTGQEGNIRRNRVGYLVPLTNEKFAKAGQLWVADLRLEFPLEKSVLVGRDPIEGFASDEDYSFFADKLAFRRSRPAIDKRVREFITTPLGRSLAKDEIDADAIIEVRMMCGPSWEHVERVEMHFLVDNAAIVERITRQYEAFEATLSLPADLKLLPPKVLPYDEYPYASSRRSSFIDYSEMSE